MRISATISVLLGGLLVGACAMPEMETFRAPDATNLFRRLSVSSYKEKPLPPVTAADMVDASGACAGAYVPSTDGNTQAGNVTLKDAGVPLIPVAIALEMTECDVVKRAGIAEKVDIGANDRRERTVTLTYIRGDRPGIYNFTDGRLKSMELAPAPPDSPKVATKKPSKTVKPAKPAQRAAQPSAISVQ